MRFGLLLLAAETIYAQNPMSGKPEAVEAGREVFRIYCSPCHGIRGEGGRGPDLTRGTFSAGDEDSDLYRVISDGVTGTEMQSYSMVFGDQGVWRLVAYIRSIAHAETASPKGQVEAGERLFWEKGGCGKCHVVGARGGHLGPDLTRVGRQRSLSYLRESVSAPSNDLTPGYFSITVVKPDGRQITGVQRGYDNFSVQLMDMSEMFYSFQRAEVRSVKREYRSLMPDGYDRLFNATEMDDLLAYLVSLRGAKAAR